MNDQDLANKTTTAIHNAFLMGWSIQELKSKVLLRALVLPSPAPANESINKAVESPINPLPAPASDSTNGTGTTTSSSVTRAPRLPNIVDSLLEAVLPPATSQKRVLPSNLNENLSRKSEWQAIFIRLASVHNQCFPASTTANTLYDPSPKSPLKSRFPYLYPSDTPDYALIGVGTSGTVGIDNFDDDNHLGNFKLYDVTRRTLNCLNLLYTQPQDSLLPDIIYHFQNRIVQSISPHVQSADNGTPTATEDVPDQDVATLQEDLNQEVIEVLQEFLRKAYTGPATKDLDQAIKFLSFLTVRFLESWDGYLRENFYAGGQLNNNELELLAYEAGRSLSSLSWGISLMTVPLESDSKDSDSDSAQRLTQLSTMWMNVFKSSYINMVQRQVSALGPALDDAYYAINNIQRPAAGERPNPDLPSNAIHAITYSLVYWQRAVEWMCQQAPSGTTTSATTAQGASKTITESATVSTPPVQTTVSTTTTETAIAATTTSTTVSTSPLDGTAKPLALTPELSRQLRQTLISQASIWQTLMLGEQTLRSFTAESVTKRLLNIVMANFENSAKNVLLDPAQKQLKRLWTPLIVVGILLLVILGGGIFVLAQTGPGQLQSVTAVIALLAGGILTLVSTVLTRAGSTFSPASNAQPATTNAATSNTNLDQRLSSMFGLAEETIVTAFQNAYKQILIEFDDLNHYVAISYPLIDFFITYSPQIGEEIKDSYIFLTKVVWTSDEQKEEIERVARAAFGPLGTLIGPQSDLFPSENSGVTVSNSRSVTQISWMERTIQGFRQRLSIFGRTQSTEIKNNVVSATTGNVAPKPKQNGNNQ